MAALQEQSARAQANEKALLGLMKDGKVAIGDGNFLDIVEDKNEQAESA